MKKRRRSRFYYTYEDISKITGISVPALKARRARKEFSMDNLESVSKFIVKILLGK